MCLEAQKVSEERLAGRTKHTERDWDSGEVPVTHRDQMRRKEMGQQQEDGQKPL